MASEVEKMIVEELRILQHEVRLVGKEVAALKVKAGLTGFLGGLLPAVGAALWVLFK